jgi:hypothetical protein
MGQVSTTNKNSNTSILKALKLLYEAHCTSVCPSRAGPCSCVSWSDFQSQVSPRTPLRPRQSQMPAAATSVRLFIATRLRSLGLVYTVNMNSVIPHCGYRQILFQSNHSTHHSRERSLNELNKDGDKRLVVIAASSERKSIKLRFCFYMQFPETARTYCGGFVPMSISFVVLFNSCKESVQAVLLE